MKGYIYLTTCLVTGKKYIGQSVNHRDINTYLGSGIAFKYALKRYGKDNFLKTVLVDNIDCLNRLNELEREFILKHDCIAPNGYNLDMGGTNKGRMSEETKKKIISSKTGKTHADKHIEANAKSHIGIKLSEETKKKIGKANKGKPSWNKGKKMPIEFREKIRAIMTGVKMKKKQIIINDIESKKEIICDGVVDASKKLKVSISLISLLCTNKIKHIKNKYHLVGVMTSEAASPLGKR